MSNKKIIIMIFAITFILMLIPKKIDYYDYSEYKAILYSVNKIHRPNNKSSTGYEDGLQIIILGIKVYDVININVKVGYVTLEVEEDSLTPTSATFIIKNDSGYVYCYGEDYRIEQYENNQWSELEGSLYWNDIAYILNINESKEINIDFTVGYKKLSSGKYRLVKTVFKETNETIDNTNIKNIYAEFEIK